MVKSILKETESRMKEVISSFEEELRTYRVGKANPSVFKNVMVDYYGTATPLVQAASVSTPDATTLMIQPWDKNMLSKIEKAIIDANLGFTPANNGEVIHCNIPPLTEDRRRALIKKAGTSGEDAKISIRNARRDGIDMLKMAEKDDGLAEDEERRGEEDIQKLTDKYVGEVDRLIGEKSGEIMDF